MTFDPSKVPELPELDDHPMATHPRFAEFRAMAEDATEWSLRATGKALAGFADDAPIPDGLRVAMATELGGRALSITVGEFRAIAAGAARNNTIRVINVLLLLESAGLMPAAHSQAHDSLIRRLQ